MKMKSSSIKKTVNTVPKGFARSELYSDIGLSCDPLPFGDESEDEDSSTGTLSDFDEEVKIPVIFVPVKKKKVPTVILQEETDFK
jgi:hypothetical protein